MPKINKKYLIEKTRLNFKKNSIFHVKLAYSNTPPIFTSKKSQNLTNKGTRNEKGCVLNLDYCVLSCKSKNNVKIHLETEHFHSVETGILTNVFGEIHIIYSKTTGERVAQILCNVRSSMLDKNLVHVKIQNHLLYNNYLSNYVYALLSQFELDFKFFNRLDICLDFNKFKFNRCPHKFILDVLGTKILKNGRSKMHFIGSAGVKGIKAEYLRYGKRNGSYCIYLYNKSLELKEVKDKDYIKKTWDLAGLDYKNDVVWRLECSLSKDNLRKIFWDDKDNIIYMDLPIIEDFEKLNFIFHATINKGFSFKKKTKQKNKSRMPDVELFSKKYKAYRLKNTFEVKDKTRINKIILNKMFEEHYKTIDVDDFNNTEVKYDVVCYNFAKRHSLLGYFHKLIKQSGDIDLLKYFEDVKEDENKFKDTPVVDFSNFNYTEKDLVDFLN